jgi:phosphatidylglycerol---prolipoprotein diacylglyceryl transferase
MFIHNINPTILSIGPLEIRWYGLFYVLGFVMVYLFLRYFSKKGYIKLNIKEVEDVVFWSIIGMLIGARAIYFLVYNFSAFVNNPLEIVYIWHGGMSFHGGLIGVILALLIFSKIKKVSFYSITDFIVIPVTLCLALGRIGNFVNGELFGRISNLPWSMNFNGETVDNNPIFRHPSQIYEALKNVLMFFVLWFIKDKKLKPGTMSWLFVAMYGILRFFIEYVREPEIYFGPFTAGQVLCLGMIIFGGLMLVQVNFPKKISNN